VLNSAQPILFAEADLPQRPVYDPQDVAGKLHAFLDKMRAAASWPWKASTVAHYRTAVWPQLLAKLADTEEVEHLRTELEAEAARLDAVQ
jgi:hypothetical protein